jgi:hypothetical protein
VVLCTLGKLEGATEWAEALVWDTIVDIFLDIFQEPKFPHRLAIFPLREATFLTAKPRPLVHG